MTAQLIAARVLVIAGIGISVLALNWDWMLGFVAGLTAVSLWRYGFSLTPSDSNQEVGE